MSGMPSTPLAVLSLVLLLGALAPGCHGRVRGASSSTRNLQAAKRAGVVSDIFAPSYVYPCSITKSSCAWYTFVRGATVVMINPNSGPGTTANSDYVALVGAIRASTTTTVKKILGYVPTTYGARDAALVKADMLTYKTLYGVTDFFFDEGSAACTTTSYYQDILNYGRASISSSSYAILNWGTAGPECFLTTLSPDFDVYVTFEDTYTAYTKYAASSWVSHRPVDKFYHIVHTTKETNVATAIRRSKLLGAKHVYVTPDIMPNPYDTAPGTTYWSKELKAAAASA